MTTTTTDIRAATHWALRVVVAAGLFVDAFVHLDLAPEYDVVVATISEGTLFRLQAGIAAAAGVLVLLLRRPVSYAIAGLVAVTAVAALLVSAYAHVGEIGPFPDMFEPTWFPEKRLAVIAESVAAIAAIAGLLLRERSAQIAHPRHERQRPQRDHDERG